MAVATSMANSVRGGSLVATTMSEALSKACANGLLEGYSFNKDSETSLNCSDVPRIFCISPPESDVHNSLATTIRFLDNASSAGSKCP